MRPSPTVNSSLSRRAPGGPVRSAGGCSSSGRRIAASYHSITPRTGTSAPMPATVRAGSDRGVAGGSAGVGVEQAG